ncbi:hypothetical protein M405DRAFT_819348 [Rhizopogon salebrosus TDB-379]|nr:hypothetical protein M405DRAFT_819348 [Rhizopogon salebrosus TDB-379]
MVDTDNAKSNASSRDSPRIWVTSLIKTRVDTYSCSPRRGRPELPSHPSQQQYYPSRSQALNMPATFKIGCFTHRHNASSTFTCRG